jgi:hypothetical protein
LTIGNLLGRLLAFLSVLIFALIGVLGSVASAVFVGEIRERQ